MNLPRLKQPFFRWFLITWPLTALILAVIWIWLFYAFFIVSLVYWAFPFLKKLFNWVKANPTKLAITIILLTATVATVYFWYKAERWSDIVQFGDGWYTNQVESYRSLNFEYLVAFYRIIIIWIISIVWSIFIGFKNKIK